MHGLSEVSTSQTLRAPMPRDARASCGGARLLEKRLKGRGRAAHPPASGERPHGDPPVEPLPLSRRPKCSPPVALGLQLAGAAPPSRCSAAARTGGSLAVVVVDEATLGGGASLLPLRRRLCRRLALRHGVGRVLAQRGQHRRALRARKAPAAEALVPASLERLEQLRDLLRLARHEDGLLVRRDREHCASGSGAGGLDYGSGRCRSGLGAGAGRLGAMRDARLVEHRGNLVAPVSGNQPAAERLAPGGAGDALQLVLHLEGVAAAEEEGLERCLGHRRFM
mmetsp:Transcript_7171/g.23660  ORF Transcript_7171/g.23660 Transcript_7171/m.23660 type:complete len:281 (+) Transcript_7171:256-1098(+)